MLFTGTSGDDVLVGTSGDDVFNMAQGGNDTVSDGAGNDEFDFGATFTAADHVDGGTGSDTLSLIGDYSAGLVFAATSMTNIETLSLGTGFSYSVTLDNANVTLGNSLTVNASTLVAGNMLIFDGSAETSSSLIVDAGAGNDVLFGGGGADSFDLTRGGNDTVNGEGGNDLFLFGATFTATDNVDGGTGNDTLDLIGNYSGAHRVVFAANTIANVEKIVVHNGYSYILTLNAGNLTLGGNLTVDGSTLSAARSLTLDISALTDGTLKAIGGAGNDTFIVGSDLVREHIDGGAGTDRVVFNGDIDMTITRDTIVRVESYVFDANHSYDIATGNSAVTFKQQLTVDASALHTTDSLNFNGSAELDGTFNFIDGAGNDYLTGGHGDDFFNLSHGGSDVANGGAGNDIFNMGAAFSSGDQIDGGAGNNTLVLNGDYASAPNILTVTATMMANIQTIELTAGHSYGMYITSGAQLADGSTITGAGLGVGDVVAVDASAAAHSLNLTGGAGNDYLGGSANADNFDLSLGGADIVVGGGGADQIYFGAALDNSDSIDASASSTIELAGNYTGANALTIANLQLSDGVDTFHLAAGFNYQITAGADAADINIDASALGAGDHLSFDGSANRYTSETVTGGAGDDTIVGGSLNNALSGGAGNDSLIVTSVGAVTTFVGGDGNDILIGSGSGQINIFIGGAGQDMMTGSPGSLGLDHYVFNSVAELTGAQYDSITNFDCASDKIPVGDFDPISGIFAINTAINAGTLDSGANFDAELASAIGSGQLGAYSAVLFSPNAGSLAGQTFLIIDGNGHPGYQAEADLVVDVTGITGTLSSTDFL